MNSQDGACFRLFEAEEDVDWVPPNPKFKAALRTIAKNTVNYFYCNADGRYASDKWMKRQVYFRHKSELWRKANEVCLKMYGTTLQSMFPRMSIIALSDYYEAIRKSYYKHFRDKQSVCDAPLFGDKASLSVIYAYAATHEDCPSRVLKIGFTTKPVDDYIEKQNKHRKPVKLGSMIGTKEDEAALKARFGKYVAAGDEFFWPNSEIIEWIRDAMKDDLAAGFDNIIKIEFGYKG